MISKFRLVWQINGVSSRHSRRNSRTTKLTDFSDFSSVQKYDQFVKIKFSRTQVRTVSKYQFLKFFSIFKYF